MLENGKLQNHWKYKEIPRTIAALGIVIWSEWRDLNPRPHGPEPCALPAALHPEIYSIIIRLSTSVKRKRRNLWEAFAE